MKLQIKKTFTVNGQEFTDVKAARIAQATFELETILGKDVVAKLSNEQMATVASALNLIREKKVVVRKEKVEKPANLVSNRVSKPAGKN